MAKVGGGVGNSPHPLPLSQRERGEQRVLPLFHVVVGLRIDVHMMGQVVILVADAAERQALAVQPDHVDLAAAVAVLLAAAASEALAVGDFSAGELVEVEPAALQQPQGQALLGFQGHAEGAHQAGVGRDDDFPPQQRGHGQRHGPVVADAPLHEDFAAHLARALHAVVVVH